MRKHLTARDVAEEIISDHAFDIEYLSIWEAVGYMIERGFLPEMGEDEFDAFVAEVDRKISSARVEVTFT